MLVVTLRVWFHGPAGEELTHCIVANVLRHLAKLKEISGERRREERRGGRREEGRRREGGGREEGGRRVGRREGGEEGGEEGRRIEERKGGGREERKGGGREERIRRRVRTETRGRIKEGEERESRRGRMKRRGEKERGGEEGRKEREGEEGEEGKRRGGGRKRKEEGEEKSGWERREMVKTFCSKLTHSTWRGGEEGELTSSPATTAMVVGREAAHTPSRFSVFSSIPDTTTSGRGQ